MVVLSFSDEISLGFYSGQYLSDKMSNQKRIGLEGTIKAYAGCSRIIATIQRSSSTELPAESGENAAATISDVFGQSLRARGGECELEPRDRETVSGTDFGDRMGVVADSSRIRPDTLYVARNRG